MFEVKVTIETPGLEKAIYALADALSTAKVAAEPAKPARRKKASAEPVDVAPAEQLPVAPDPVPTVSAPDPIPAAAPAPVVAEHPVVQFVAPTAPDPVPAAAPASVADPAPVPAPVPTAEEMPVPPAPVVRPITLNDIAMAGARLIDCGKMNDLLAMLNKYGVHAVTQLTPEQYDAVAADLRAMGAAI